MAQSQLKLIIITVFFIYIYLFLTKILSSAKHKMQTAVSHEAVASFPEVLLTTFTVSLQDKYSYKPVLYKPTVL